MKTANGVYYNLKHSVYTWEFVDIGIKFYFSSQFYLNKFQTTYREEVERFNQALNNVYKDKFNIDMDILALIRLYTLIEKRGFYIKFKGVEVTCPEDLRFVGMLNLKRKLEN